MKCKIYAFLILFILIGYVYCADNESHTYSEGSDGGDNDENNYQVTENTGQSTQEEQPLAIKEEPEQEEPTQPTYQTITQEPEQIEPLDLSTNTRHTIPQPRPQPPPSYQPPQPPHQPTQPYYQPPPYGPYQPIPYPYYGPYQPIPYPYYGPYRPQSTPIQPPSQRTQPRPPQPTIHIPGQPPIPQPIPPIPVPQRPPIPQPVPIRQPMPIPQPQYQPYVPYGPQPTPPIPIPYLPIPQYQPPTRYPLSQPYTIPTGEPGTSLGKRKVTHIEPSKTQKAESKKRKSDTCGLHIFCKKDDSGNLIPMNYRDYEKTHSDSSRKKYTLMSELEKILCDGGTVYVHEPGKPYVSTITKNMRRKEFVLKRDNELIVVNKVDEDWITSVVEIPEIIESFTKDDDGNEVPIPLDKFHIDLSHFKSFKFAFMSDMKCHKIIVKGDLVWEKTEGDEGYPIAIIITTKENVAIFFSKKTAVYKRKYEGYKLSYFAERGRRVRDK
uniref:SVSP4 n=1 Tax=Theileria annulata TaxID=5874 RepID=D3XPA4_THEAN|nr:SVSP4 [Theileria annulata]